MAANRVAFRPAARRLCATMLRHALLRGARMHRLERVLTCVT